MIYKVQNKIRLLRKSRGLSQNSMAKELGVSRSAYINFENGKNKSFSTNITKNFADYFGISEVELLYGRETFEDEVNYKEQFYTLKERYSKMLFEKDEEISKLKAELEQTKNILEILSSSYKTIIAQNKEQ